MTDAGRGECDDPIKCESIVARVGPILTRGNFALSLTCRKKVIERMLFVFEIADMPV